MLATHARMQSSWQVKAGVQDGEKGSRGGSGCQQQWFFPGTLWPPECLGISVIAAVGVVLQIQSGQRLGCY